MADTEDLRAASRALKDAISGLSKALGQGVADIGADVGREVAKDLDEAARALQRELSDTPVRSARAAGRSAKAERTRADLLAAARSLFAERGYEATSVAELAQAAGYTKGALYAHFASKEELFVTLITQEAASAGAAGGTVADEAGPPVPSRHAASDVMLSLESYLYAMRHPESRPVLGPIAEQQLRDLAERIARLHGAGQPGQDDLDAALALSATWTVGGIMAQVLPQQWDVEGSLERIGDRLTR